MNGGGDIAKNDDKKNEEDKIYKILIVDDEKNELNALSLTLKYANQFRSEITLIEDPEDALTELEKNDYDLVLSDFNMPTMSGVEFLNIVREKHPEVARLLITATPDYEIAKDAINQAQIDNFIEKPWYNDELRAIIYNTLTERTTKASKCAIKVDDIEEALTIIKVAKNNLFCYDNVYNFKRKVKLEFNSADEFNKFYHRIIDMKNVKIDDLQVFDEKFLIKLTIR